MLKKMVVPALKEKGQFRFNLLSKNNLGGK